MRGMREWKGERGDRPKERDGKRERERETGQRTVQGCPAVGAKK